MYIHLMFFFAAFSQENIHICYKKSIIESYLYFTKAAKLKGRSVVSYTLILANSAHIHPRLSFIVRKVDVEARILPKL